MKITRWHRDPTSFKVVKNISFINIAFHVYIWSPGIETKVDSIGFLHHHYRLVGIHGPQNAVLAIFIFLENRIFSEKIVPQNIFTTGYFIATFSVYRQKNE